MSFVMSIFVLGYKMTLLEKHARLQIRKWNLEARMDTDTMLNKKAARGRRFSWACQQCEVRHSGRLIGGAAIMTKKRPRVQPCHAAYAKCYARTTPATHNKSPLRRSSRLPQAIAYISRQLSWPPG